MWNPDDSSNVASAAASNMPKEKISLYWFRRSLRLHDNPALMDVLRNSKTYRCIYILDPWFAGSQKASVNKWRFLLQSLEDLDAGLRKLNSRLFVVRGQPANALPHLFKLWNITTLGYEVDPEPFGRGRDEVVHQMSELAGVEIVSHVAHTLYDTEEIREQNGGQAPLTYKRFQRIIESMGAPPVPKQAPTLEFLKGSMTPIDSTHDKVYGVPTLEELNFETDGLAPAMLPGGETEALSRLDRHLERKAWIASFEKPKMTVQSLFSSSTSLSPYLRFGCLSARLFYWRLTDLYMKVKKQMPPLTLYGQLLWREFFYTVASHNQFFDRMRGNPVCVQIPWSRNPDALAKWAEGKTGFPWIDAIMTQLKQEGWIHHLARHAVACFLTRGDLWVSWEEGMKVFEELLLDADWSMNAGSWLWLSCSSFFQPFFCTYCPINFGKHTDPNGDYIRKYLPVLQGFPAKYIFEPWTAPVHVQKAAKCVIGKDYPLPIVNHLKASTVNMDRMKQVYQHLAQSVGVGAHWEKLLGLSKRKSSDMHRSRDMAETTSNILSAQHCSNLPYKRKYSGLSMDQVDENKRRFAVHMEPDNLQEDMYDPLHNNPFFTTDTNI